MIKAFIFDIGNVLLHYSHEKMTLQISEELQVPFDKVADRLREKQLINSYESGSLTTDDLLQSFRELSSFNVAREALLHAMNSIFTENPLVLQIVYSLKRQKKKLLLLSNTNEAHFHFIKRQFPWIELFDAAILSYEIKESKPNANIYKAAVAAAGCAPEECFYVDDMASHIEAARQLGIDAERFINAETLREALSRRMVFV